MAAISKSGTKLNISELEVFFNTNFKDPLGLTGWLKKTKKKQTVQTVHIIMFLTSYHTYTYQLIHTNTKTAILFSFSLHSAVFKTSDIIRRSIKKENLSLSCV